MQGYCSSEKKVRQKVKIVNRRLIATQFISCKDRHVIHEFRDPLKRIESFKSNAKQIPSVKSKNFKCDFTSYRQNSFDTLS